MKRINNANEIAKVLNVDIDIARRIANNSKVEIRQANNIRPFEIDKFAFYGFLGIIGTMLFIAAFLAVYLTVVDREIPAQWWAIITAIITGLFSLFVPSPFQSNIG